MRLRALHLASVLLLLASLGAAEGSVLREGDLRSGVHYIGVLLAQDYAGVDTWAELNSSSNDALRFDLPVASLVHHRAVWTMRPPSAQCTELQAVTGFSL